MEKTILLIDGSSFIFRAFYAVKNLTAPSGMPTNAIYGIINMLKQMQKKYTTPHWVCVFDAKGKTFRDELYPQYKANRRATPEELSIQIPYIHELIQELGIPIIVEDGVEADDVIATIAKKYAQQGYTILIATGDKDFAQIVGPQITLINTMTNEVLDEAGVINKFGVRCDQIIDYLSLIGDSVDNVPGVAKCGPKTAQKWLEQYGSISNLIVHQHQLGGVVGENFRQAQEWLPLAQQLITIDCNVNIQNRSIAPITNLTRQAENTPRLVEIFRSLNFRTWLKEAELKLSKTEPSHQPTPSSEVSSATNAELPVQLITNPQQLATVIEHIISHNTVTAFHILLNDHQQRHGNIAWVSLVDSNYVHLIQFSTLNPDLLSLDPDDTNQLLLNQLAKYWSSPTPKIAYQVKNYYHVLANYGLSLNGVCGDLALANYLYNSTAPSHLASIIHSQLNLSLDDEESLLGKGSKRQLIGNLAASDVISFLARLSQALLPCHQQLLAKLSPQQQYLYLQTELPLSKLLYQIERNGIGIATSQLNQLAQQLRHQLQKLEEQIQQLAGIVFNLNSPKQLQDVLFTQLKYPTTGIKKNSSGYSTDEESLTNLANSGYPIAELILQYRYLSKLMNTYLEKLPGYADTNGRVHTSLEQTVASSGRLSSKDPNLQNIPVRSHYGQAIRECFVAAAGHQLICADYSQIELRVLAHICGDTNLINAFSSGMDIHLTTASQIFNKPQAEVTKDERRYAKTINFGLIYGKSVFGLAKELKIERAEAKLYIDNYFAQYPQVLTFMEQIKKFAHNHGFVETIYGRKVYLSNINSSNAILRQADERLALNAPMQGSAADIIKIAMLNVQAWLEQQQLTTKMVLQVHDELIFEAPEAEVAIVVANLGRLMSEPFQLKVPLVVEAKAAANWGLAH